MIIIKSALFYLIQLITVVIWATLCLVICPFLSFERRFFMITRWSGFIVWLADKCCGITYEIEGLENIPEKPVVVVAKHQSTWETFMFQNLFAPTATVLKKELMSIPFFGWTLHLLEPIIIDRSQRKRALAQIKEQGAQKIKENRWIVIYPEGTRIPVGSDSRLAQGAFILAKAAEVPVLPVVHNAGEFWRPHEWLKRPGKITVRIGKPISTKHSTKTALSECAEWMTRNMHERSRIELEKGTSIQAKQ
jgi:1-acyl-sn-glycerol-3-phosphate acyltransferase